MRIEGSKDAAPRALDYAVARMIYKVLLMYYQEQRTQADIGKIIGQSAATVNRLIKQGRDAGMVEITISPLFDFQHELERRLTAETGLEEALVVPAEFDDQDLVLRAVGQAAAHYLLSRLKDGDTICISGGKGVSAVVEGLRTTRSYKASVVPATGLVQGRHYIDVNHVASELAGRLGGTAYQIHAPMFADSDEQRDMLRGVSAVADVLDRARKASIALVGIGSVLAAGSSYLDFALRTWSPKDRAMISNAGAQGEVIANLLDATGALAPYPRNALLVGLAPDDLRRIPCTIGVAAGPAKVAPICSVLHGGYLKTLVTDERTASAVLDSMQEKS